MARIRTIKPEYWTSEQVVSCSPIARLLFIGLWNFCDDAGRHPASPSRIKMQIFPADPFTKEEINGWIDELSAAGLLERYVVEGQELLQVTGWHHQRIDKPNIRYPAKEFDDQSTTSRLPLLDRSTTYGNGNVTERETETEQEGKSNTRASDVRTSAGRDVDAPKCACDPGKVEALTAKAYRVVPNPKPQDRSLIEKAARLAVLEFGEHWFIDAVEATRIAYARDHPPKKPRGAYLHGTLSKKCAEIGKGDFNAQLASIELHQTGPPSKDSAPTPRVQFRKVE